MDKSIEIDTFNRFSQVSRETIKGLKKYEFRLIEANKKFNLIGKSTINSIWTRHFLDSAQVIDLIDKNSKILIDLGSGAGLPGIILAIMAKDRKISLKTKLIEKSSRKAKFLKTIIDDLNLNVEVINKNIFESAQKIDGDVFVARAFKPLEKILELMHNKTEKWQKIIIFLGKKGNEQLLQASKIWDIEYKQRGSITSNDSKILEIKKIKKR